MHYYIMWKLVALVCFVLLAFGAEAQAPTDPPIIQPESPAADFEVELKKGLNNNYRTLPKVPLGKSTLAGSFQYSLDVSNRTEIPFLLFWNISSDGRAITFAIQTTPDGAQFRWFGLGFGSYDRAHCRADIAYVRDGAVEDRWSSAEEEPELDVHNSFANTSYYILSMPGRQWQTAVFTRPVGQDDWQDRPLFLDRTNSFTWAVGSGENSKHAPTGVGAIWIDLSTGMGKESSHLGDEVSSNATKGAWILAYVILLYIGHRTIFIVRHLHMWHKEYFFLHYFKFSVFDGIIFVTWIIAVIGFAFVWWDPRKEFGIIFAVAAEMPAAYVFIAAIRFPIWEYMFHISFERQIRYHRWIAWTLFYLLAAHSLWTVIAWAVRDPTSLTPEFQVNTTIFGAIAALLVGCIALFAVRMIRRARWELFWFTHYFFVPFVVFGALHHLHLLWFMIPGMFVYATDKIYRWIVLLCRPAVMADVDVIGDVVRVSFKKEGFPYKAGQFLFVVIPEVSRWQIHPFSVSSSPRDGTVTFHAKSLGQFTSKLKAAQKTSSIYIEGPYGYKPHWKRYSVVVLFGAGIGATPWISILRDYLLDENCALPTHMYFFYTVPNKDNLKWFQDTWDLARSLKAQRPGLRICKYVTRKSGSDIEAEMDGPTSSASSSKRKSRAVRDGAISDDMDEIKFARPLFSKIMVEIRDMHKSEKEILVMTCGPGSVSRSIQDACFILSDPNGCVFDYHDEVFKF